MLILSMPVGCRKPHDVTFNKRRGKRNFQASRGPKDGKKTHSLGIWWKDFNADFVVDLMDLFRVRGSLPSTPATPQGLLGGSREC